MLAVDNLVTILLNSLMLALALGFLIIVLWYDFRQIINQFFALFLILVIVWNAGSLLSEVIVLLDDVSFSSLSSMAVFLITIGFSGASVGIYVLITAFFGMHSRWFRFLALSSIAIVITHNFFLIVINFTQGSPLIYQQPLLIAFYLIFDFTTLYLIWQNRRKVRSRGIVVGTIIFIVGQGIYFLNPELGVTAISSTIVSFGVLVISFSIIQQLLITPLEERISQVEAMNRVSLAIGQRMNTPNILKEITSRVVEWLDADSSCIFLLDKDKNKLSLVAINQLPESCLYSTVSLDQGVAGYVVSTQQTTFLENYEQDWSRGHDFEFAPDTFGSVIAVPLVHDRETLGTLMVMTGKQGRLFDNNDVELLNQFASQVAVAISQGILFQEQHELTQEVQSAHGQLKSVLSSTDNPVIAVDRAFNIIFSNPSASALFTDVNHNNKYIFNHFPHSVFPDSLISFMRVLKQNSVYVYEITFAERIYSCHIASIGSERIEGWVAVLNDITELKELDRMKSEMVRMTSHDLKNPLQGAIANLELLQEDIRDLDFDTQEAEVSVDAIEKQLHKMERIIRGILDLERTKHGESSFEFCQINEIVVQAVNELSDFAVDNGVSIHMKLADTMPMFTGDVEQFKRAVINLIENAIKFTPKDRNVWITTYLNNDSNIMLEVKDEGVGIPEAIQSKIFDRFFRGEQSGVEHVSGSGLGLSFVKTIVENHHGRVWLESEMGQGTVFYICIQQQLVTNISSHSQ